MFLGRGNLGVEKVQAYLKVEGALEGMSPKLIPPQQKRFKTRDLQLPFFEGCLPDYWLHFAAYTCTLLHPYFPVAKSPKDCSPTSAFLNFSLAPS